MGAVKEKEFHYTEEDFKWVKQRIHDQVGINLNDSKREMVYSRLARRIRKLGYSSFAQYRSLLQRDNNELIEFVNAITTNVTSFFRENHHFEAMVNEILPELMIKNASTKTIKIWSAGCSTGEEPYSIAMTVMENVPSTWKVKILATDLDTTVLEKGRKGIYPIANVSGIPKAKLKRWFWRGKGANQDKVKINPVLQKIIEFRQLNLMGDWGVRDHFDIIFCRNVVIYFTKDTQRVLFERYANQLTDSGYLFLGHSESLHGVSDKFKFLRQTMHKKV